MDRRERGTPKLRQRWPLRRYLIGLVALFIAAATAGIWSSWVQTRHDALSAARQDAVPGARLAADQIGRDLAAGHAAVTQVAANPAIDQILAGVPGCQPAFSLSGGTREG